MEYLCMLPTEAAVRSLNDQSAEDLKFIFYPEFDRNFPLPIAMFDQIGVIVEDPGPYAFGSVYNRAQCVSVIRNLLHVPLVRVDLDDDDHTLVLSIPDAENDVQFRVGQAEAVVPDYRKGIIALLKKSAKSHGGQPSYRFLSKGNILIYAAVAELYEVPSKWLSAQDWFYLLSGGFRKE